MSPWLTAFVVCLLAIIAEGLFAGNNVREHLRQIKQPRASPPMWLWIAIGLAYYVICYTILFRLFARSADGMRTVAVGLVIVILAANAFWNYLFFRAKNFLACLVLSLGYGVLVVALLVLLVRIDRTSAFVLLPYVAYLTYAGRLQYSIWRLNS
jgi:tryptophan-rich sensory protein